MKGFFRLWTPQCICLLITLHLFPHIFADDSSLPALFYAPSLSSYLLPTRNSHCLNIFYLKDAQKHFTACRPHPRVYRHLWKRINCYVADNGPCVMGRDHVTPWKWIRAQQEAGDSHRQGAEMSPDSCSPKHGAWHGAQSSWTVPQ